MYNTESGISIVCCEYDKYGKQRPAIYVVKRNAEDKDITRLSLRSRFNPELEYYATAVEGDDDYIVSMAKVKLFREPYFVRI